jgi:hypothetical protein
MREWRQRFGYEYEVVFPGIRRLFTTGKEVVLAAEKDGRPYLIIDEDTCSDFNAPDFEDKMHALVSVIEFRHSGERVQYLNDHFGHWRTRLITEWNTPAVSMSWESWSLNGEACIENLVPTDSGGAKLKEYLCWTMRELASHCRRVYDASGMIPFEFQGSRTPSAFARALDHWFDLALLDPISIRERVRRLGVDADTDKWPAYWVERENILLLAEERQVTIPAAPGRIAASVHRKWEACLHVVGNAAEIGIPNAATKDKHSFLAGILVAVHKQPPGKARKRPSLDDSLHRHEELVTALGQVYDAESRPVTWHALWRLPPGMVVADPPRSDPWMHYPAVSVVSSVAPLTDSRCNGEACS